MSPSEQLIDELTNRFVKLSKPMSAINTDAVPKLKKLNGIRIIMYDFYGTLFLSGVGDIGIDDGKSDAVLMTEVLKNSGINIESKYAGKRCIDIYSEVVAQEIKKLKNLGIEYPEPDIRKVWGDVMNKLLEEHQIKKIPDVETQSRISVEFETRMNPVWPVEDAIATLLHFKKKGLQQGIISNSQFYTPIVLQALTGKKLAELGLNENLLHWSFEEKMKKPGLLFYENAWAKIKNELPGIKPEEVLYAGNDMLKDIWPASKLGIKTALFAGDQRSLKWRENDERCKNLIPDIIFTEFAQLKEVI